MGAQKQTHSINAAATAAAATVRIYFGTINTHANCTVNKRRRAQNWESKCDDEYIARNGNNGKGTHKITGTYWFAVVAVAVVVGI